MKDQIILLCIFALVSNIVVCSDNDGSLTKIKRSVYNYFYGSSDNKDEGPNYNYYVNECGYLNTDDYNYYVKKCNNSDTFIGYNDFPVVQKTIAISDEELTEVIAQAQLLQAAKCDKEKALIALGVAEVPSECVQNEALNCAANSANLVEIIYEILANRYNVHPYDYVKFTTNNPLPTDVCNASCIEGTNISELDRILPAYCVQDCSKTLKNLPSPRSLSLLLNQYKNEEYEDDICLNSFGFFLFQAFSNDIQLLANKSSCGDSCVSLNGCNKNGKCALVDTLRSENVDVLNVCSADPFYGYYGKTCISSRKYQNINPDCEIRKRAPANLVSPFIDLSNLYTEGNVAGFFVNSFISEPRASQSTPLAAIYFLQTINHNFLALTINDLFGGDLTIEEIFNYARQFNTYIWQLLLYQNLLPKLLGPSATSYCDIDSTESCYNPTNTLEVPVETIIVALRYLHTYIPEYYFLYNSFYEQEGRRNLDGGLDQSDSVASVLRGLFATNLLKDNNKDCPSQYSEGLPQRYKDDLRTLDIQAARDVCVEPYLQYIRKVYNISATGDWNAYNMFLRGDKLKALSYLYKCPQDLELAVGSALDSRFQSVWGDLNKIFVCDFFHDLKCSDPNFWSNALTGDEKAFFENFDAQSYISCIAGLQNRPNDLFCPYGTDNVYDSVSCDPAFLLFSFIQDFIQARLPPS